MRAFALREEPWRPSAQALGAVNWRHLTPRLLEPGGVERLARAARAELAIAAAVFTVTAVLVATALPGE